jgi:choline-sulfatase
LPAGIAAHHALTASAPPAARDDRPNFLFMIADDLTYRSIHSLNNREVHTPNLDRFVASGSVFTHYFHQGSWSGAVCVPSRTMLNTGLTAFRAEAI